MAAKTALEAFGPFTVGCLRFLPAGLLLLLLARVSGLSLAVRPSDRKWLILQGVLGIGVTYGIFYIGQNQTTATDGSLLIAFEPVLLSLVAWMFLHERLSKAQWGGLLLGVAGVWLIAGSRVGDWIALSALCFECFSGVIGKRLVARYSGLLIVGVEMVVGGFMLIPLAIREMLRHPPVVTWQAVAGLLYLCLICSALCYAVWYRWMARFPLSSVAALLLIQPVLGPLLGWLLRGEALKANSALGGVLVIIGIAITTLSRSAHG